MSATYENGCLWMTHSRYDSQWAGNLPYAPRVYWNVRTDCDIIPVCTYGYKNLSSAQKQIVKQIRNILEIQVIHVETQEEHHIQKIKWIAEIQREGG